MKIKIDNPGFRYPQFDASKHRLNVQVRLRTRHHGIAHVDVDSAKHSKQIATFELCADPALSPGKDRELLLR